MKPKTKRDKSVGRVMWTNAKEFDGERFFEVNKGRDPSHDRMWTMPILVLPLSNPEAIIERRAKAMYVATYDPSAPGDGWEHTSDRLREVYIKRARATLVSDGWAED